MADIDITITGARGAGKTTLAKLLYGLLTNSTYYIEEVEDSNTLDTQYVQDLSESIRVRRRAPRSIELRIVERSGFEGIDLHEDDE